ncbi:NOL1/NOP2/sun family putative RNA methylase [Nanoarchaeota archaeon]
MNSLIKRYKELGHPINPDFRPKLSIRINTLKTDKKACLDHLKKKKVQLKKIPFLYHGYWAEAPFSLVSTAEYLQGYYYIQEAASQLPAQVLSPEKGELVLDMTASPGSKTTQLAQMMENQGQIIALESKKPRIPKLNNNLERLGVKNTIIYHKDARYASDLKVKFDKILLDAPCSGNYTQDPEWFKKRSIQDFKDMAKLQKSLLRAAIQVLKPTGTLVYSTCSLEPEENEEVIEWALENLNLKLDDSNLKASPGLTEKTSLCRRFWPDPTQGFFIAKLTFISD